MFPSITDIIEHRPASQYFTQMTRLANGNLVVLWGENTNSSTDPYQLRFRLLAPDLSVLRNDVVFGQLDRRIDYPMIVFGKEDGSFVVFYDSFEIQGDFSLSETAYMQTFDHNGNQLNEAINLAPDKKFNTVSFTVFEKEHELFAINNIRDIQSVIDRKAVNISKVIDNGTFVSSYRSFDFIASDALSFFGSEFISFLPDGRIVDAIFHRVHVSKADEERRDLFEVSVISSKDGVFQSEILKLQLPGLRDVFPVGLFALSDGGYVAAVRSQSQDFVSRSDFNVFIFDASGNKVSTLINLKAGEFQFVGGYVMNQLEDGTFSVNYSIYDTSSAIPVTTNFIALYDRNMRPIGQPLPVGDELYNRWVSNGPGVAIAYGTHRSTMADGSVDQDVSLRWIDTRSEAIDQRSDGVVVGTPLGDRVWGGAASDRFFGLEGDDTLTAGAGNDSLIGGGGSDFLIGDGALSLSASAQQIRRLYMATLDRAPDEPGWTSWTAARDGGQGLDLVAAGFVNSAEFQQKYGALDSAAFVTRLYRNVLDREPDAGGLAAHVAALNAGTLTRTQIVTGFSESAEFKAGTSPELQAGQIVRLYGATLARAPDAAGFEGWTDALGGGRPLLDIAAGFVDSAELQAKYGTLTDRGFVMQLYRNVLGREGDFAEIQAWTNQIITGLTRTQVLVGISESPEYTAAKRSAVDAFMREAMTAWSDTLVGGPGDDRLTGGRGSDRFVFTKSEGGSDTVYGFESFDTLELNGFGFATPAQALATMSQQGGDVVFSYAGGSITFEATQLATLQSLPAQGWVLA